MNEGTNVLPFPSLKLRSRRPTDVLADDDGDEDGRVVAAVVTVTRFIDGKKVHAQVPVFADQVLPVGDDIPDLRLVPELSELLADGAVEANAYLDRVANTVAAKPLGDFSAN